MRSFRGMLKEMNFRRLVEVTVPALADMVGEIHPQTIRRMIVRPSTGRPVEDAVMRSRAEGRISAKACAVMLEALRAPWWRRLFWWFTSSELP